MVKINILLIFICAFLLSCGDAKNDETAFETLKNDMIAKSGVLCELKPDTGPCRAYIPRFYFDQESQKCKEFIWGGCLWTVPFETMSECMNACE